MEAQKNKKTEKDTHTHILLGKILVHFHLKLTYAECENFLQCDLKEVDKDFSLRIKSLLLVP